MPNIALVLKSEISRLARKELSSESRMSKKAAAAQRAEILALKRRLQEVESQVKQLVKLANGAGKQARSVPSDEAESSGLRFSAKGMAGNRKRLGLSAAEFGLLVGTTGQSIYAWESGKSKPRAKNLPAISVLRGIGKKEALARLEAVARKA
jgi:DNA-binding transcriptional regulator YiaG